MGQGSGMRSQGKILRKGEACWGFNSRRITRVDVVRVDCSVTVRAEGSVKLLLDLDHGGEVEVLFVQVIVWLAEECTSAFSVLFSC